jgi:hypothetical protein
MIYVRGAPHPCAMKKGPKRGPFSWRKGRDYRFALTLARLFLRVTEELDAEHGFVHLTPCAMKKSPNWGPFFMAEGAGFEPAIRFPVCTLSKRVP